MSNLELERNMNASINDATREAFDAAKNGRIPDAIRDIGLSNQAHGQAFADKVLGHISVNTQAALDAWKAMASARSIHEAGMIQMNFMQQQFTAFISQGQELAQLSTRSVQDAASKGNGRS